MGAGELVVVGCELCRALAAVHGAGLVHGDVKTSNVVRDGDGKLVLVDFGAARSTSEGQAFTPEGTLAYLAPEVAAGGPATELSDLFALGALLFRLATGRHPSETGVSGLRDLRPDLPSGLVASVDGLLAEQPVDRPAAAGDAERLLVASQKENSGRDPRRHPWWLAAVLAFLLVAVASWWAQQEPPSGHDIVAFQANLWGERGDSEIHLADGSAVRPGDRLALRIQLEESAHVYVFNEDEAGNLFVLFPLPGLLPANPLAPGGHRLPGNLAGEPQSWEVTSAGGKERFLIVGSRNTLPELERLREEHERARRDRPIEHSEAGPSGETLRGVGGLQASSPAVADSLLSRLHTDLTGRAAVWTELLVLDNPR